MQPCYYIIDSQPNEQIPASIREATAADFERTAQEHWQTDWRTDFIQDAALQKYALDLDATKELVGLAAYRDMPEGCWFMWSIWRAHPAEIRRCPSLENTLGSARRCWRSGFSFPLITATAVQFI